MPLTRLLTTICDERMNQKLWSGFTAATLLIMTLGIAPLSYADPSESSDEVSEASGSAQESSPQVASPPPVPSVASSTQPSSEAVKVGEYQSAGQAEVEDSITEIYPHQLEGRQAVTLYVQDIPVLTFLGSPDDVTSGDTALQASTDDSNSAEVKVASVQTPSFSSPIEPATQPNPEVATPAAGTDNASTDSTDPVWRATSIAAHLNQIHRDGIDANTITAEWDSQRQQYLVKIGEDELVAINSDTVLPNSTNDPAQDALHIANLLRRQLGDAPPLQSISGDPQTNTNQISLGPFRFAVSGMASWYGPGFDGNYSASGEIFDQHAMTAAHRSLPFGTQVRVTNVDNGLSVVVRINDRGPFTGGRVIDLSMAAAQAIGLIQTGVAPVNVEVLDEISSNAGQN